MSIYLALDDENRLTLGGYATSDAYLLEVEPDGTLILTPAVAMAKWEASLLAAPEIMRRVELSHSSGPARSGRPERKTAEPTRPGVRLSN